MKNHWKRKPQNSLTKKFLNKTSVFLWVLLSAPRGYIVVRKPDKNVWRSFRHLKNSETLNFRKFRDSPKIAKLFGLILKWLNCFITMFIVRNFTPWTTMFHNRTEWRKFSFSWTSKRGLKQQQAKNEACLTTFLHTAILF